jgi:transcriptional regulator with XRE-family HTH domain
MTTEAAPKVHLGRNIRHFRQESNLKQDELADRMGDPWTQKKISQLEAKAVIEDSILEQVARALEVSLDEIKEHNDVSSVTNVQNNYENSNNQGAINTNNFNCSFNPLDKVIEAHEDMKRLHEDVKRLYEALLKEKDEKIALLTKVMNERK